jgi:hypothetical protein
MLFLFRAAFWLTVVFLAIPPEDRPKLAGPIDPSITRMIAHEAEKQAVSACVDQAKACLDGALIAQEFGVRATRALTALGAMVESTTLPKGAGASSPAT